jgi:hypothetical protein
MALSNGIRLAIQVVATTTKRGVSLSSVACLLLDTTVVFVCVFVCVPLAKTFLVGLPSRRDCEYHLARLARQSGWHTFDIQTNQKLNLLSFICC